MGDEKSSGFDRMSKLADSDDVFEDTFTLKENKEEEEKKEVEEEDK